MKTKHPVRLLPVALLLLPLSAQAFCGLHFCPRVDPDGDGGWQAGVRTRLVTFDLDGHAGHYVTASPRVLWTAGAFTLGTEVPLTRLRTGGETRLGLSNPLLTAQYNSRVSPALSWEAGIQLELPFGDADKGLGDDHTMILPWVGARRHLTGSWFAAAKVGYSQAFEFGDHDHGGSSHVHAAAGDGVVYALHAGHSHGENAGPVLVNPHGDREIHLRTAVGHGLARTVVEGYVMGQIDVSDSGPVGYLRAGLGWERPLSRAATLRLQGDVPVTPNRRADVEVAAGVMVSL